MHRSSHHFELVFPKEGHHKEVSGLPARPSPEARGCCLGERWLQSDPGQSSNPMQTSYLDSFCHLLFDAAHTLLTVARHLVAVSQSFTVQSPACN